MAASLIVITGPMFSGKSGELIRLLSRHTYARKRIITAKPVIDTRQTTIRSRRINEDGLSVINEELPALEIANQAELEEVIKRQIPDVLAIDECHFF